MLRSYHFTTNRFPSYRELQRYTGVASLSKLSKIVHTLEYDNIITINKYGKVTHVVKNAGDLYDNKDTRRRFRIL